MISENDKTLLIGQYVRTWEALNNLRFAFNRAPEHFRACEADLKAGRPINVENIEYQAVLLKSRASDALRAIGALHKMASEAFPEQSNEHEEAA